MELKSFDDVLEEMEQSRLHPTWLDRWNQAIYYPLYRAWKDYNPAQLYREARWFLQRGRRGWADCDTWSLDDYLAGWLPDALKHLAEHTHGYPSAFYDEENDPEGDAGFAEWKSVLGQMAEGFRAHTRKMDGLYEEQLGPYPLHRPASISKEAWRLLKDARFEQAQELTKQDELVFQRGMALFVEHLGSLWD
jgi:hypothetical protein